MAYFSIEENMKGKTAFITGGTSGIGKSCVEAFINCGVNVVFIGRNTIRGNEIESQLNHLNKGVAVFLECDVTNHNKLQECIETAVKKFNKLDVLVNCAGYFPEQKPVDAISIQDYKDVLECNLVAYFVAIKAALPYLRTSHGSIINIGSVLGTTGDQGAAAYCSTKGAIESLTRSIAIDEAHNGVRVNEVKPGHINTEMFVTTTHQKKNQDEFVKFSDSIQWLGRGGNPEEVAYTVLFLASDWAGFITGEHIHVAGGFNIGKGPKTLNPFLKWSEQPAK